MEREEKEKVDDDDEEEEVGCGGLASMGAGVAVVGSGVDILFL